MFNWAKQQLANVAGTQEPIYGPSAIRSVAEQAKETPYSELTKDDLKWKQMEWTSVETQSFYFFAEDGRVAIAQVIYSSVAGLHTTCQFTCKVFAKEQGKPHLWSSSPLSNVKISDDHLSFSADNCSVKLSEDGNSYTISSKTDQKAIVDLKITKTAPGFQAGKDGTSDFGTDAQNPWGWMRHAFWPRCTAEGAILSSEGPIDFKGRAFYVYCLQGMKPHHAAARWNFVDFQGENYSASMMEFTTPPSYGSTVVNVGSISKDGEIVGAGCDGTAAHVSTNKDAESEWPAPKEVKYVWNIKDKDGKSVDAVLEADVGAHLDRVDVMAEVPGFVKTIVANAAGTKPYIFQYGTKATLKLKIGGEEVTEEGQLFCEATFLSDLPSQ